jgi:hypothetical protein
MEDIFASVQSFLSSHAERPKQQHCPECLSEMKYIDGLFWIPDTDLNWHLSLPFCPTCDSELCAASGSHLNTSVC